MTSVSPSPFLSPRPFISTHTHARAYPPTHAYLHPFPPPQPNTHTHTPIHSRHLFAPWSVRTLRRIRLGRKGIGILPPKIEVQEGWSIRVCEQCYSLRLLLPPPHTITHHHHLLLPLYHGRRIKRYFVSHNCLRSPRRTPHSKLPATVLSIYGTTPLPPPPSPMKTRLMKSIIYYC